AGDDGGASGGGASGDLGTFKNSTLGCGTALTIVGGTGGAGGAGGRGGDGGQGGPSGASGTGGAGGLGTPGMVKLHASVVLPGAGQVVCDNHTASTDNSLRGRVTLISNMHSVTPPALSDDAAVGYTTNDLLLKAPAPYAAALNIPVIPDLAGGPATGGICLPAFWNQADVVPAGTAPLELVRLDGAASPFAGFDQVFLVNNGMGDVEGVSLSVTGYPALLVGTVPNGAVWTTTVASDTPVAFGVALEVVLQEPDMQVYTGGAFTLNAVITGGVGAKTCRWLRDGAEVQQGASTAYAVSPAALSDAGAYTVEVTDDLGQTAASAPVQVAVADPVTVSQPPAAATAFAGAQHVFTVAAVGGHGTLHYRWRRGGADLGAPDLPFLTINPVLESSAGLYDVVVTDALGAAPEGEVIVPAGGAALTVLNPLAVTGPSSIARYVDAAQAAFSVDTTGGVPPYTYEWRFAGAALPPAEQPGGPLLTLAAPLAGRAGTYDCVVRDSNAPQGQVISSTATLSIFDHLSILAHPQGGSFAPGATATLTVVVSGGMPALSYEWRKGGAALPAGSQPNGPVLTLGNLAPGDAGAYDVVIRDQGGESVSSNAAAVAVTTAQPLQITASPASAQAAVGQSHTFTVETAGGTGTLSYQWKFEPLDGGKAVHNVGGNTSSLEVAPVTLAAAGDYWVEVSDDLTTVSSDRATLEVTPTPLPAGGAAVAGVAVALAAAGLAALRRRRA
ncbi:MAG TPA: immunoglobulin domain-containing protein, partial [Candidatus Hydrogenedentes bacterium]|nr:immunoglobulin domain-containing protein [Candidatus Hydrogenedentota bacterium]